MKKQKTAKKSKIVSLANQYVKSGTGTSKRKPGVVLSFGRMAILFIAVFGGIGSYLLFSSFADTTGALYKIAFPSEGPDAVFYTTDKATADDEVNNHYWQYVTHYTYVTPIEPGVTKVPVYRIHKFNTHINKYSLTIPADLAGWSAPEIAFYAAAGTVPYGYCAGGSTLGFRLDFPCTTNPAPKTPSTIPTPPPTKVPTPTPTPAPKPPAGSVFVTGRAYDATTNAGVAGAKVLTCQAGTPSVTTDSNGNWQATVAIGAKYCAELQYKAPTGWTGPVLENTPEHATDTVYIGQVAGTNDYHNTAIAKASDEYTWDRPVDTGFNFKFTSPASNCTPVLHGEKCATGGIKCSAGYKLQSTSCVIDTANPPTSGSTGTAKSTTPHDTNHLELGQSLLSGDRLFSDDNSYRLTLQDGGNIVIRNNASDKVVWDTGTDGKGGVSLLFDANGNLRLEKKAGGKAVWATGHHDGADRAKLTNYGYLEILDKKGHVLWNSANDTANNRPQNYKVIAYHGSNDGCGLEASHYASDKKTHVGFNNYGPNSVCKCTTGVHADSFSDFDQTSPLSDSQHNSHCYVAPKPVDKPVTKPAPTSGYDACGPNGSITGSNCTCIDGSGHHFAQHKAPYSGSASDCPANSQSTTGPGTVASSNLPCRLDRAEYHYVNGRCVYVKSGGTNSRGPGTGSGKTFCDLFPGSYHCSSPVITYSCSLEPGGRSATCRKDYSSGITTYTSGSKQGTCSSFDDSAGNHPCDI